MQLSSFTLLLLWSHSEIAIADSFMHISSQGRMNDLNMMLAGHAKRETDGSLGENQRFLEKFARYTRLWNVLFYASISCRHAPFATNAG